MQQSAIRPFEPRTGGKLRVLVSVTDKSGLSKLKPLLDRGADFISTGGTAIELRKIHGIPCTDVFDITGSPEMLNGRVKLLHPNIFAGLLADQGTAEHMETIAKHDIKPFHVVFVSLYDFKEKPGIGQIDVGGPSAIRAAAKNGLIVVIDVSDYDRVVSAICSSSDGSIPAKLRLELIIKVFKYTSEYDNLIATWLQKNANEGTDPFSAVDLSTH
jgi:phosphoribosylaminoimidazolecarboxamide formyltransferase/IMP cyclohydrolase